MKRLLSILLFFAAPFIGLFYICVLPFLGLYMFINLGVELSLDKIRGDAPIFEKTECKKHD
jgi:hypothetical protein